MTTSNNPIDTFLAGIEAGDISNDVFARDAVLDATVPNWRFTVRGGDAVRAELRKWYADPGHFDDVRRSPLADGELVEFDLRWEEGGVPHACHQAHVLRLRDGWIASATVWCGGRWPAALIEAMAAAGTND